MFFFSSVGQEHDFSDSSGHSKSRSSGADTSKLPQPNWTRNRSSEKSREESGISRSPSLSGTAEEKPPTGRKADEPKLVTVRSIAPITAGIAVISEAPKLQYPLRKMDSSDQPWWLQDSDKCQEDEELNASTADVDPQTNDARISKIPSYGIRKMDSSDRNRWSQEAEQTVQNNGESSCVDSISCEESTKSNSTSSRSRSYGLRKMDSSDRNRWLQEASQENCIVDEKSKSCGSGISSIDSTKSSTLSNISPACDVKSAESTNSNVQNSVLRVDGTNNDFLPINNNLTYSVRKMDSFDTPWWLNDTGSCASEDSKLSSNKAADSIKSDRRYITKSPETAVSYGVRKMDSFDSPWWLSGDEAKQVNSSSDNSIKNRRVDESDSHEPFPINRAENEANSYENERWYENDRGSRLLTDLSKSSNENSNIDETENNLDNYLDSKRLEPWDNDNNYASVKIMDSSESQWWDQQDRKHTDARSTSISIDWSRDDPESSNQHNKNVSVDSRLKNIVCVRKMDSFDSPSWLASEESETQSHEPKQTSSGDVISSSSKQVDGLAEDSSPDWWGGRNHSDDDFVRTKRTSLRIKNIEAVANDAVKEPVPNIPREPNLQDELDQLMLFIGGCRNIDELLGNEEPPPAAPTTPPDTDSGNIIYFHSGCLALSRAG